MRTILIAAVCAAAFAAPALAQERVETRVEVKISRAEARDPQSADKVYAALRRAAERACDSRSLVRTIQHEDRACAARALDVSVARVNQPVLTARHQTAAASTRLATGF